MDSRLRGNDGSAHSTRINGRSPVGSTSTSAPFGMALVISRPKSGDHGEAGERRALHHDRIGAIEDQSRRHHAARASSRAASRRWRRRPWRHRAPARGRDSFGRRACARDARTRRQCGRDRNARKIRRWRPAPAPHFAAHAGGGEEYLAAHRSFPPAQAAATHCSIDNSTGSIAVAAEDVGQLRRVGREPPPAVRLRHFARIALIEAHAGENAAAGLFDARGEPHAVGIGLDLRARHHEQRNFGAAAVEHRRELSASRRG